ncbi:hypothetical protein D9M69_683340 [compost metagenome]
MRPSGLTTRRSSVFNASSIARRFCCMRAWITGSWAGSTSSSSVVFRPLARVVVSMTATALTFTSSWSINWLFSAPMRCSEP